MRQFNFGRSPEESDTIEKRIEVLQKYQEVLEKIKNEKIRNLSLRMLNEGIDELETEEDFNGVGGGVKLNLSEHNDDSRRGFCEFDDPDLGIYTNIEGLGEDMREIIQKNQGKTQKAHRLIERMQDCINSDQELEALQSIKWRAVDLGTKLCQMLVDFVFSMRETEKLVKKFQSLIGCFTDYEDSLVIKGFTILLEMTKLNKSSRGHFVKTEELELEEDEIDDIIREFIEEIMRLRDILELKDLPESRFLKREVRSGLETGIKQCEGKLEEIEMEGIEFFLADFWESQKVNSQREEVKSNIDEVWKGFWLSEDANH